MPLSYKLEGMERISKKLDWAYYAEDVRKFFADAGMTVERGAKQRAPVDTGRLRASITSQADPSAHPLWAKIGTDIFHAPYLEWGTGLLSDGPGPHRRYFPPGGALNLWASRHGFASGYLVARAIFMAGGTKPRRFLRGALEDSIDKIGGLLADLGNRIRGRWESR